MISGVMFARKLNLKHVFIDDCYLNVDNRDYQTFMSEILEKYEFKAKL